MGITENQNISPDEYAMLGNTCTDKSQRHAYAARWLFIGNLSVGAKLCGRALENDATVLGLQ